MPLLGSKGAVFTGYDEATVKPGAADGCWERWEDRKREKMLRVKRGNRLALKRDKANISGEPESLIHVH